MKHSRVFWNFFVPTPIIAAMVFGESLRTEGCPVWGTILFGLGGALLGCIVGRLQTAERRAEKPAEIFVFTEDEVFNLTKDMP